MRKAEKAATAEQMATATRGDLEAVGASNVMTPPPGEEIDAGDVEEVIRLDDNEAIDVVYRGYKETKSGKPGEVSRLHKLVFLDGVARGLWGTLQLNAMLDKCAIGDKLWIAYLGKHALSGGNEMHTWRVVRTAKAGGK